MLKLLNTIGRLDRSRPGVPGEHWVTFAIGLRYFLRQRHGTLASLGSKAVGLALIARALSGRDGLIALLKRPRLHPSEAQLVSIAPSWPYDRQVRISAPSDESPM